MIITYDPEKRRLILENRGLDLAHSIEVFAGPTLTIRDDRQDYGEVRWITIGLLDLRMVVLVWTARGKSRRVISMRKANDREQAIYSSRLV
jgi:uncharacterized protein